MDEKRIEQRIQEYFDKQNYMTFIGAVLKEGKKGRVAIGCQHWNELTQHQGTLHAGVLASIADMACGCAALSVQDEKHTIVSSEFQFHLLRPAAADEVIAVGTVLKAGRRLCVTEAEVRDVETNTLLAKMTATMIPIEEA